MRASHVVYALRRLLAGPAPAEGDLIAATAVLHAHLAEMPATAATAPRLRAVGGPPTWKLWHPGDTTRTLAEGTEEQVRAAADLIAGPVIIESPTGLEWERS